MSNLIKFPCEYNDFLDYVEEEGSQRYKHGCILELVSRDGLKRRVKSDIPRPFYELPLRPWGELNENITVGLRTRLYRYTGHNYAFGKLPVFVLEEK